MSVMELGHLLTRSGLTYLEVSSEVCHDSFCQLGNSVSLRCNYQMFIINFCLNMFRASLCPSSGEQRPCVTAYGVLRWFCWMWLVSVVGRCVVGCEQSVGIAQSVCWLNEQWIGARFRERQDSLPFSRAHQASSDTTEGPLFETRPAYEADLHLISRLGLRGTIPPPTIHLHGMMPN